MKEKLNSKESNSLVRGCSFDLHTPRLYNLSCIQKWHFARLFVATHISIRSDSLCGRSFTRYAGKDISVRKRVKSLWKTSPREVLLVVFGMATAIAFTVALATQITLLLIPTVVIFMFFFSIRVNQHDIHPLGVAVAIVNGLLVGAIISAYLP